MGIIRLCGTAMLAAALGVSASHASGFKVTGLGTRGTTMGGAFRAIADDWSAAYYNPAGYAFLTNDQLGGNASFVHLRNEITPDYRFGGSADESGVFNGTTINNEHEVLSLPSAGFAVRLPFWGETVFGLSAYQPFDYNVAWKLFRPIRAYNDSASLQGLEDQYVNNLDVVAFQLTAGREFMADKMALGVGLQLLRADLFYRDVALRENPMASPLSDRPYDRIPQYTQSDGSGWGFGITAGMLYKYSDEISIGVTASLPFDITVKGTTVNRFVLASIPTLTRFDPNYQIGTVGHLFASGDIITTGSDFEAKIKLPPSFGLGLSYQAMDNLMVGLDFEYTFWSKFDGLQFVYANIAGVPAVTSQSSEARALFTSDMTVPAHWANAGKLGLGASWDVKSYLTVLAGGSLEQSATRGGATVTPQFMDIGEQLGLSIGGQFHIQKWDLGISTHYYHRPDLTVTGLRDVDDNGVPDNFPGTLKADTYETILSFTYRY